VAKTNCSTGIWEQLAHNLQVTSAGCAMLCPGKSFLAAGNVLDLQTTGFCGLEELVAPTKLEFRSFLNQTGCSCLSILVDPDRYKVNKVIGNYGFSKCMFIYEY